MFDTSWVTGSNCCVRWVSTAIACGGATPTAPRIALADVETLIRISELVDRNPCSGQLKIVVVRDPAGVGG
jgi:hypothetical protein